MKKLILSVLVLLGAFLITSNVFAAERVFKYAEFNGKAVYIAFDTYHGRVSLKIRCDIFGPGSDASLNFLKSEVLKIINGSTSLVKPVGDSRVSFHWKGGYPIWGPYESSEKSGTYCNLMFVEGATFIGNFVIEAKGIPDKPTTYYPYFDEEKGK